MYLYDFLISEHTLKFGRLQVVDSFMLPLNKWNVRASISTTTVTAPIIIMILICRCLTNRLGCLINKRELCGRSLKESPYLFGWGSKGQELGQAMKQLILFGRLSEADKNVFVSQDLIPHHTAIRELSHLQGFPYQERGERTPTPTPRPMLHSVNTA